MLIWVLTIVLIAGYAAIGYGKGAVRMIFPIAGLFLGAAFAKPLSPMVKPLIKTTDPIWAWLLPPAVVFLTFAIVFIIIGLVVHHFVILHYKYKVDDMGRIGFDRVNKRLGACLGVIAGSCWAVAIGLVVYILGYFSVQFASGENDPTMIRYLNQARTDMKSSGLEKIAAMFDSMPERYYQISDILGLVYNNPAVHSRLANYPAFLSLSERQEFQDMASDTAYQQMLQSKQTINTVIYDPKTQGIINNQEIMDQLRAVDLKDLRTYLETGKSAKYEDLKILGRWAIDVPSVIIQARVQYPGLATNTYSLTQFKKFATNTLPGIALVAAADNKVYVKMPPPRVVAEPGPGGAAAPAAPAVAAAPRAPQLTPQNLARYGPTGTGTGARNGTPGPGFGGVPGGGAAGGRGGRGAVAPPPAPRPATAGVTAPRPAAPQPLVVPIPTNFRFAGQGTWQGSGEEYDLSVTDGSGRETKAKATIDNDRLLIAFNNAPTLVLFRTQ